MAGAGISGKQQVGIVSLAFMGLSAMLGSGWLLASYFVFQQAGTFSVYSWLLGFVMVLVVALSFAETCSVVSEDGATVLLPRISHGYFLSAIFGFFGLISWIALIPIEVTATMQYLTYFIHGLYVKSGELSHMGYGIAVVLAVAISLINSFSLNWIKSLNNYIFTPLKIGIPAVIIGYALYHAGHMAATDIVHTHSFKGIFTAIPLGVIFSFNAFKTVCVVSGRAKDPHKTILGSLLLSLVLCLLLYAGLQMAFDFNVTQAVLSHSHSPYAAILRDSVVMLTLLYVGAISSPFTANVFNLHAGNACLFRMAKLNYLPEIFTRTNKFGQYIYANIFNIIVAMLLLLRGNAWHTMVNELTCIMVITYAAAPIALISFRRNLQNVGQKLRLSGGQFIGLLGFVFSNFMIFWCGYAAVLLAMQILGVLTVLVLFFYAMGSKSVPLDWVRVAWLYIWLGAITVISKYSTFGGSGVLLHQEALLLIFALSVVVYIWVGQTCLPESRAEATFRQI